MTEGSADIGVYGLAVMGANLALNFAEKRHMVAVSNRSAGRIEQFADEAGSLKKQIVSGADPEQFVRSLKRPRSVIIMVQAGSPVDQTIELFRPYLEPGDTVIDAGNANFLDTVRRTRGLDGSGLRFVGMGVSGGEEGARHGPSIMVGGSEESWRTLRTPLQKIAADYNGEPCVDYMGPDGAGHFVKTIHNGIEYADMQMIAEVYGIFRDGFGWDASRTSEVFENWNNGRLNSYLIEITGKALATTDPKTGMPMVDVILDSAGQKGTGRWSVIEAQKLGVPASVMEAAVAARSMSSRLDERVTASGVFGRLTSSSIVEAESVSIGELEAALLAGKIAAYAQGFAVLEAASQEHGWNLPLQSVAKIWRAGCIIRSAFLDEIASAFDGAERDRNLMLAPVFADMLRDSHQSLRRVVGNAVLAGIPVPALSAALAYLDDFRRYRGTANLIQAQRDFFGAHGFRRTDEGGDFHGPW